MKIKKCVLLTAINLALFAGVTHAGIKAQFIGHAASNADVCTSITGAWKGEGHVSALSGMVDCQYTGTGNITAGGTPGSYNVHVELNTDSSWPCRDVSKDLLARCENGAITIDNDDVQLNGTTDGNTATFRDGSITFSGISATIDYINLTR